MNPGAVGTKMILGSRDSENIKVFYKFKVEVGEISAKSWKFEIFHKFS